MKKVIPTMRIWIVAALLITAFAASTYAAKRPPFDRVEDRIQMINWDTKTITLGVKTLADSSSVPRYVMFDDKTAITFRNNAGSMDMVKEGRRVICLGKFDERGKMTAMRIDVRSSE